MSNAATENDRQIVVAPAPSSPTIPQGVINVECGKDEEVEWIWTETSKGRFVSGFKIVQREKED